MGWDAMLMWHHCNEYSTQSLTWLSYVLGKKPTGCPYKMLHFCPLWRGLCIFRRGQRAYLLFCGSLRVWHQCKHNNCIGYIGLSKSTPFWSPTGDAPTASEWSTSLLPAKEQLILKVWRYWLLRHNLKVRFAVTNEISWKQIITAHERGKTLDVSKFRKS